MGESGALGALPETASEPSEKRIEGGLSPHAPDVPETRDAPGGRRRRPDSDAEGNGHVPSDYTYSYDTGPGTGVADVDIGTATSIPPRVGASSVVARAKNPRLTPWVLAAPFFALYSLMSVLRYERRETMSWDLGIFTQAVRQYAHLHAPIVDIRGKGLNLLGDHFHPILATLAPFFAVFPSPITLLVAQAFLFAVAAVPITRTATRLLGPHQGAAVGIAYGLSWGVVEAVNFDFHELAFAIPLLAFSLCAYLDGEDARAICWALPLLVVKEDIAMLTPFIIGMVLHRRWKHDVVMRRAAMTGGIVAGIAVFFLLIKVVIPYFNPQHIYFYWSNGGCVDPKNNNGVGKLISCATQQEMNGLGTKERTVFLTLVPTAFLALRSPITLLAVPTFAMKFLNTSDNYWGTDYHYGAVPMVIVFAAALDGLIRIKATRERERTQGRAHPPQTILRGIGDSQLRHGAVAMLAIGVGLSMNFPLQDLLKSETYKIPDRAHALQHAEAQVPDDVSVETTINMLAPLAARTHAYWIGFPNNTPAPQYVAIDLGPQEWNGLGSALALVEQRHPGVAYEQVYKDPTQDVYVFRQTAAAR